MKKIISAIFLFGFIISSPAYGQIRLKDIVDIEGVRDNILVGYGLVVGLNGTGDKLSSSVFTRESLVGMLERLGVNAKDAALNTKNVAAVMVTATLPPFIRQGSRIDVTVSALGDSTSLQGGTLLVTPILGADGEVYAVAQGGITVSTNEDNPSQTTGRVTSGAIVEREIPYDIEQQDELFLILRNPDFTTANRIADLINAFIGEGTASALDLATVKVNRTTEYINNMVGLITDIEQLRVAPDQVARVIIDKKSGIIVMGEEVRISRVAVAHENLSIRIEQDQAVEDSPFTNNLQGEPALLEDNIVYDPNDKIMILRPFITLQNLINGLNSLGVSPRDMIDILQAIKASGGMQAEIEVL